MSYRDQLKYLEGLRKYESTMSRDDLEAFKMFQKRHKDEDEFDTVSMGKLKAMYDKYIIHVDKSKFDSYFKK